MNIVLNARFLNYPHTGIGRYFLNLLKQLAALDSGNRYRLVIDSEYDMRSLGLGPNFEMCMVPNRKIFIHKDLKKTHWEQVQFRRFVQQFPASLVHIPYVAPYFRKKNPLILTVHDLSPLVYTVKQTGRAGVYDRYYIKFLRSAISSADSLIADSDSSKNEILRFLDYPSERIAVVHLAADERFKPDESGRAAETVKNKFDLQKEYIFYLGDSSFRKNLQGLFQAYHELPEDLKAKYDLVLCGNSKNSPKLRSLAASLEKDRIKFLGFVDNRDIPVLYSASVLFVFPSIYEGFGLPPLEAMSCGTPVITSHYTSLPEVVGDAGILVDTNSVGEMTRAMTAVLSDMTLRKELIQKGIERSKKFNWKKTAQETLNIYEAVHNKCN